MEIYGLLLVYKQIIKENYGLRKVREHFLGQAFIQVPLPKVKLLKEVVRELSAGTTPDGYLEKHGLDESSVGEDDDREVVHHALRAAYHESQVPAEAEGITTVQVLQIIPPGQLPMY